MPDAIIHPRKGKTDPEIGPVALMAAMRQDVVLLGERMGVKGSCVGRILTSELFTSTYRNQEISLVGPLLGAPHAVMILEKLRVLGARKFLFFGWCGSLQPGVRIGDILLPDRGIVGEGTSAYYAMDVDEPKPSAPLVKALEESLAERRVPFHRGPVWSTDAPYRETAELVASLQKDGVLGVDMELSALLTAARFRRLELAALLVVSDELGSLSWRAGFSSDRLKKSRIRAAEVLCAAALSASGRKGALG